LQTESTGKVEEAEAAAVKETAGDEAEDAEDGTADTKISASSEDQKNKRVYVGNLAWEVGWQDLKDHMKSTGLDVKIANVLIGPDGRSKGCGIVEFHTAEDAQKAVEQLNDTELRGRQIFVREDREDQRQHQAAAPESKGRRVYVGNLSWDVAWQDLKDHMREAGEVVHAEVIREHTGRSKGCGIVEYATEEEARNAITTMTDTELQGRMIFVREDRETGAGASTAMNRNNPSVYVWNLAPETTWQELKDHMRKAGNVDSATILPNTQGDSTSCGVVVYQRPQEAIRAIRELQHSELNGQTISIREDRNRQRGGSGGGRGGRASIGSGRGRGGGGGAGRGRRQEFAVQVDNLASQTTWRELKDHFRQCGEVTHAEVKTSGSGTVMFSSKEDAETAVSRLNGSELQGSKLQVGL
jgi:RNA recognition motif-containing protein